MEKEKLYFKVESNFQLFHLKPKKTLFIKKTVIDIGGNKICYSYRNNT